MRIKTFLLYLILPAVAIGQDVSNLDFTDPRWVLRGKAHLEPHLGLPALRIGGGVAELPELVFTDGTIEFDMAITEQRSFVGLNFRSQADGDAEYVYFRPHKSALPDAVQYTPVFKGASQWQLYHDASATAAAELPDGEWIHVRLVVAGSQAAVFLGESDEPALLIPALAHPPRPGFLRLRSGSPGAGPNAPPAAAFANLVVRPGAVTWSFPATPAPETPPGVVTRWSITPAFATTEDGVVELPATQGPWQVASTETSGLLLFDRWTGKPTAETRWWASLARLRLVTDAPRTVRFNLGFSDDATVFLDGRPLYSGRHNYSFNLPRRQGLITLDQATLFLPLEKGENELVVAVTERFGGWGLIGQLLDAEGVQILHP